MGMAALAPAGYPAPGDRGTNALDVLHQLVMEPKHSEGCPKPHKPAGFQCLLHWLGSPCRAAPGHGVTVSTGPSIPLGAIACVTPSHGWTFRKGFLWTLALFGMNSWQKTHFALNQRQTCRKPAVGWDIPRARRQPCCIRAAASKPSGVQFSPHGYGNM